MSSGKERILRQACGMAAAFWLGGCAMSGNPQSARIREPGTSGFGLTFGLNTYALLDSATGRAKEDSSWAVPILIPEIAFSTVLHPRFEIGGRASVQAVGVEGFLKWGFFQGKDLALALSPTLGARALPYGQGTSSLPLLAAYRINDRFGLHGGVYVGHSAVAETNNDEWNEWTRKTFGSSNLAGFSLGVEFTGETFHIRPLIEFSAISPAEPERVEWKTYGRTSILIHLGWVLGSEKQQLDRMEKKIDRLSK